MARQRSTTDARKPVKPATRWGAYVLMGVLLAVVAAGAAAQMLAASPAAPDSAATVSTTPPAANVAGASNAAGGSSSERSLYVYGDQLRPLVEETGGVQTLNIYGPGGQIIAQVVQGGQDVRHLLTDHLGSTRVVLDAEGNVVARFEYGPYGETTAAGTAAAEVRYRYTGHPWNEAQGVYETPARGYDPTLGRFLSVDPKREGASPYVYAGNNPVGYVDPTGGGGTPFFVVQDTKVEGEPLSYTESTLELFGRPRQRTAAGITKVSDLERIMRHRSDADARDDARAMLTQGEAGVERNRSAFIFLDYMTTEDGLRSIAGGMKRLQSFSDQLDGNHDSLFREVTIISDPGSWRRAQNLFTFLGESGFHRVRAYRHEFVHDYRLREGGDMANALDWYAEVISVFVRVDKRQNEPSAGGYYPRLSQRDYAHAMGFGEDLLPGNRVTDYDRWEPRLVPQLDNRPQPVDWAAQAPHRQLPYPMAGDVPLTGFEPNFGRE